MRLSRPRILKSLATVAMLIALSPASPRSQSRVEVFRLAADSPLATDGSSIFGVATDLRTILVSAGAGTDWRVFARRPTPNHVTGLVWDRGSLYLSDEEAKAVFRISVETGSGKATGTTRNPDVRADLVYKGRLRRPRSLAFSDGLLVADSDAHVVYRVDPGERTATVYAKDLPPGEINAAADRRNVTITSPQSGEVRVPAPFSSKRGQSSVDFSVWQTRTPATPFEDGTQPASTAARRHFQPITNPGSPALANGSLYLVDEADGSVYVSFRQQARPIPVAPFTPTKRPARLLIVGDSLMVLDGIRGLLDRWPLPIPTELDLGENPERALDSLYLYLHERGMLATRRVPWRGSLEQTLRDENVIRRDVGPGLRTVVCGVNRTLCVSASATQAPSPTQTAILIPDVPIESALDLETLTPEELADGTLGEKIDNRIVSPAFLQFRAGTELWELNASRLVALDTTRSRQSTRESWGPYTHENLRGLRRRDFPPDFRLTIPVEKVRAFVAVPRALWRDDERLGTIRLQSAGFNWNLLEDIEGKGQSGQPQPPVAATPPPPPPPCNFQPLAQDYARLRETIHYVLPDHPLTQLNVGIVDTTTVDVQHPAFGPNYSALEFVPPQKAPAPPEAPSGAADCTSPWKDIDHATAVAGLIAGRTLGMEGFAPNVRVVAINGKDDVVGQELFNAFRHRSVRIFNLSMHYKDKFPTNLRLKINDMRTALFVVSAGNDITDSKPVCESPTPYPAYPVCDGYRKNVLVVAATGLDGTALIDRSHPAPGSNWNEELVQIAAPGTGYYAPGFDNTYKPVRGTSFAAPLVTATAALLFAEGVQDPWLIKQRIIATADQRDNLLHKVFGAGLLNVARAVMQPKHDVLWTTETLATGASKDISKVVELEPNNITISWQTKQGGSRTLPLADVRRLTRNPGGTSYRIVYHDEVTDSLVVQGDIDPGNWPIEYRVIDPRTGAPTGSKITDQLENYKDYVGRIIRF